MSEPTVPQLKKCLVTLYRCAMGDGHVIGVTELDEAMDLGEKLHEEGSWGEPEHEDD